MQEAKADAGKLELDLVPTQIARDIAEVRMYGTRKYGDPNNWKKVELRRYINAMLRHTLAFWEDPYSVDEESGIPHYKHAECNWAFISELMKDKKHPTLPKLCMDDVWCEETHSKEELDAMLMRWAFKEEEQRDTVSWTARIVGEDVEPRVNITPVVPGCSNCNNRQTLECVDCVTAYVNGKPDVPSNWKECEHDWMLEGASLVTNTYVCRKCRILKCEEIQK